MWLLTFVDLFWWCASAAAAGDEVSLLQRLQEGVALQDSGQDLAGAEAIYRSVLAASPQHPDAWHLLGLVAHARGESRSGVAMVERALEIRPGDSTFLSNLGELRRSVGDVPGALQALAAAVRASPNSALSWRNLCVAAMQGKRWDIVVAASERLLELEGWDPRTALDHAEALQQSRNFAKAEETFLSVGGARGLLGAGVSAQQTGRLDLAEERYRLAADAAESVESTRQARVNLASIAHERGELEKAIGEYRAVLDDFPDDSQALNNLGAALTTIGRHSEAIEILEKCLQVDAKQPQALANLATHYANEGDMPRAQEYLNRAALSPASLLVRTTLALAPVHESTLAACVERVGLAIRVATLSKTLPDNMILENPVSSVENVHFYLPYVGLDDRPLQEAVSDLYRRLSPELTFVRDDAHVVASRYKRRVGFVSKFFGEHEPHGLLLEGVVRYLPRRKFHVLLFPIASPGRRSASENLREGADECIELSLNFFANREILARAELDVLVYADMLSEPMTYFLGFSRFAPVQIVFWGNPVTTGRPDHIDYFVSADRMETTNVHRYSPYSEQVVLLDGQGIWYRRPPDPATTEPVDRHEFSLRNDDIVLLCPQSVFKLHPEFDGVLADVLRATRERPQVKIVLTEGRRERWTRILKSRLPADDRILWIPRQPPGDGFRRLVACADVLLHPFPFGGSRTSSDGLAAGVPVLARPTSRLKGRMAYSFYVTMGLTSENWTLCAGSAREYVQFAAKLALDDQHRRRVAQAVRERAPLLWEDTSVVDEWSRFLDRVLSPPLDPKKLYEAGLLADAVLELEDRIERRPTDARLKNDLGATLQQLGDFDRAERELREALELRPEDAVALNNLAVTLHEAGRIDEAKTIYDRLLQADESSVALYNSANLDRDEGDVRGAVAKLRRVLGDPDWKELLRALFENGGYETKLEAVNSLVVMETYLTSGRDERAFFSEPLFETPPSPLEFDPFGAGRTNLRFDLVVQPYRPADDEARYAEILYALSRNLANRRLRLRCFFETEKDRDSFPQCHTSTIIGRRLRFSDVPEDAGGGGGATIVANADIYFDQTLDRLTPEYLADNFVALTRWEWICDVDLARPRDAVELRDRDQECARFLPRIDSQDAWIADDPRIFRGLHHPQVEVGRPRCDNFIAARVRDRVPQKNLASPSLAVKAYHLQRRFRIVRGGEEEGRRQGESRTLLGSYTDAAEIKGATAYVRLSEQWLF